MDSGWPKEACIRWGPEPPCEGAIIRGKVMPGHAWRTVPWVVQKWLNRSICHLGCGLGWAESYSPDGANVPSCANTIEPSVWRSAAAMQRYVKLVWPLCISTTTTTATIAFSALTLVGLASGRAYGSADATATPSSLASLKSDWFSLFQCRLTQVVLEKKPLNGCLVCLSCLSVCLSVLSVYCYSYIHTS